MIRERQKEGIAAAKAKGKKLDAQAILKFKFSTENKSMVLADQPFSGSYQGRKS